MSRASETILEELHNTIAETLKEELKRYANGEYDETDGDGKVTKKSIPASLIQSTIKYLKITELTDPKTTNPTPRIYFQRSFQHLEKSSDLHTQRGEEIVH